MDINKKTSASKVEYVVLVKNKHPDLSRLLTALLPSLIIVGTDLKSESINTTCATFLAASAPLAKDTLLSASLNAKTSFTPSPANATFLPFALNDITIFFLVWFNSTKYIVIIYYFF